MREAAVGFTKAPPETVSLHAYLASRSQGVAGALPMALAATMPAMAPTPAGSAVMSAGDIKIELPAS